MASPKRRLLAILYGDQLDSQPHPEAPLDELTATCSTTLEVPVRSSVTASEPLHPQAPRWRTQNTTSICCTNALAPLARLGFHSTLQAGLESFSYHSRQWF